MEKDIRARLIAGATVLLSSALTLTLAEGALRLHERHQAPAVAVGLDYGDVLRTNGLGRAGFLKEGFAGRVSDGLGGTVAWRNNAQGFRRTGDTPENPPVGVLRVLSMGDSFTAGYRVDQEQTFSRLLEKDLASRGRVEVLVSQIEEPVTGLFWLERSGTLFRPDVVLLGITLGNDIAQVGLNLDPPGGFRLEQPSFYVEKAAVTIALENRDEFAARIPEACLTGAPLPIPIRRRIRLLELLLGPPLQPIASSRGPGLSRFLLDGINGLGFCLVSPPPTVDVFFERLTRTLLGYQKVAHERGFALAVLLFPSPYAVQEEDWTAAIRAYGLRSSCFDPGIPARRIHAFCDREGIACLDPSAALSAAWRRSGKSLYLPGGDMHWNARGHRAFFEAVRDDVRLFVGRT